MQSAHIRKIVGSNPTASTKFRRDFGYTVQVRINNIIVLGVTEASGATLLMGINSQGGGKLWQSFFDGFESHNLHQVLESSQILVCWGTLLKCSG